jgi:two-component system response regulator ChvI
MLLTYAESAVPLAPRRMPFVPSVSQVRLLLVDDDSDYREAVAAELGDHNFNVTAFDDAPPLIDHFKAGETGDLIVLDWNLPSIKGVDLLSVLRRQGVRIPVIILTGMSPSRYEVEALDRGAMDFVDKSRGVSVLAKRAQLIATAANTSTASISSEGKSLDTVEYGDLVLRPKLCRASWKGHDVGLTVTEYNIVHKLVENGGEHVSYRAIYDCVHHCGFIAGSGEEGYRTNVRSSIKRIRNKFRAIDSGFTAIENFLAFGYCWRKQEVSA